MDIERNFNGILEAYSNENLNQITGKLILLYKNKQFGALREIANKVSKYFPIQEEKDAKCFSKLIMLYHPDKGEQIRITLKNLFLQNEYEKLHQYAHILELGDIEKMEVQPCNIDIDYHPEYIWDTEEAMGFEFNYQEEEIIPGYEFPDYERTFYNEIKIREYGHVNVEFPFYYLEDYDEYELSSCGMESLDGIEHCRHIKVLDVSGNCLTDISPLWDLQYLEELYLANNQIGIIDSLSNLPNLKSLDISGNYIEDISPLMRLENLEYVNLIGNPVNKNQSDKLKEMGIFVMN